MIFKLLTLALALALSCLVDAVTGLRITARDDNNNNTHRGVSFTYFDDPQPIFGGCDFMVYPNQSIFVGLNTLVFRKDYCGKSVTLTSGPNTVQALVQTNCTDCPLDGIQLSIPIFSPDHPPSGDWTLHVSQNESVAKDSQR